MRLMSPDIMELAQARLRRAYALDPTLDADQGFACILAALEQIGAEYPVEKYPGGVQNRYLAAHAIFGERPVGYRYVTWVIDQLATFHTEVLPLSHREVHARGGDKDMLFSWWLMDQGLRALLVRAGLPVPPAFMTLSFEPSARTIRTM